MDGSKSIASCLQWHLDLHRFGFDHRHMPGLLLPPEPSERNRLCRRLRYDALERRGAGCAGVKTA
ncbi:hypothetical protein FHR59_003472 [Xanthomonas arboricola]|uniref:hypothetical protein n=1 Tax=Xanthomonas arboricola TaxID=56448 RepID=UPI001614B958|nr:hypothetical protein [Xanthomonas arboricola]MBB6339182.1 hypothetical protein [Xanthomonas arboricola]